MKASLKAMFLTLTLSILQTANIFSFEQYQIIDLGLQKYQSSYATSINDNGLISGILRDDGYNYIFVIDENKKLAKRYEKMDTANPLINNNNEVFGSIIIRETAGDWTFDHETVYKWENPFNYFQYFNFHHLGNPRGQFSGPFDFKSNVVWDVNDKGQVLVMNNLTRGAATDELIDNSVWVQDDNTPTDLWFTNGFHKIEDPNFTAGYKINNHSQILGSTCTGSKIDKNRTEHASVYNFTEKTLQILNFPSDSWGYDINDNSQVVGDFYDPVEDMYVGFMADSSGLITEISNFSPELITNQGEIFGTYIYGNKKNQFAVWKDGELKDLKDLVNFVDDNGNQWDSITAIDDVNNHGYVIGTGKIKGVKHAFLLKPVSQK